MSITYHPLRPRHSRWRVGDKFVSYSVARGAASVLGIDLDTIQREALRKLPVSLDTTVGDVTPRFNFDPLARRLKQWWFWASGQKVYTSHDLAIRILMLSMTQREAHAHLDRIREAALKAAWRA